MGLSWRARGAGSDWCAWLGGGLGWNLVVELGLVTELRNFYFVFYQWFARAGALTGKIDLR